MPPKKPAVKWESEAAMLTSFMELMRSWGFRVLPECCGHDLLLVVPPAGLVRPEGRIADWERGPNGRMSPYNPAEDPAWDSLVPGDVIAVEGKLQATPTLLRQVTPPYRRRWSHEDSHTADFYVALLPSHNSDFGDVALSLGAAVWVFHCAGKRWLPEYGPDLHSYGLSDTLRCYGKHMDLPQIDIDVVPGRPSPQVVTKWKISAVRFCLEFRGKQAQSRDFEQHGVAARVFVDQGWARKVERQGNAWTYELLDKPTRPDLHYPEVTKAVLEQGHLLTPLPYREKVIIKEVEAEKPGIGTLFERREG